MHYSYKEKFLPLITQGSMDAASHVRVLKKIKAAAPGMLMNLMLCNLPYTVCNLWLLLFLYLINDIK